MNVDAAPSSIDIAMVGTFATWRLGTLQARALPFARELRRRGVRCAIVTVPWDMSTESGVMDVIDGVPHLNSGATGVATFPLAVAQQLRFVRALNPRAVHVFKPKGYGGLTGRLRRRRVPVIVDSDDWEGDGGWNQAGDYSLLQRRLFDWQERSLLRDADAVTAASHLLARRAATLRGSSSMVRWVPNGLDADWITRLIEARRTSDESTADLPTILLYSRFAEFADDWLPSYLRLLSERLEPSESVRIVVVGDSPSFCMGFRNVVVDQLGYVARQSLPSVFAAADVAIVPYADSLISRSKNSVKLLELMCAGCAVVGSSVGDNPAVGGMAIELAATNEPGAFVASSLSLLRDHERRCRLQNEAQRRARALFSISTSTSRLMSTYRQAGVIAG